MGAMRAPLLALLTLLPLAAQAPDAAPAGRSVAELRGFFAKECARCHGADGSARDAQGKGLRGEDFTNSRAMRSKKDVKMALVIRKGLFFGKAMPAFKDQLTEAEALRMVTEVIRKAEKGKAIEP